MQQSAETRAQAIFIRTDFPEYGEEIVRARDLGELMDVCSRERPHRTLDRVLVISQEGIYERALALKFVSLTKSK